MAVAAILTATAPAPWLTEPLALLPWYEHATLVEFHIEQLQAAGVRDIEVVLGYDADRIIPLVAGDNVEPIVNEAWEAQPSSTLRTGAAALVRGTTAALVIDIAEPRPASLLRAICEAHEDTGTEITVPSFKSRRGTPIVLGGEAITVLRNVRGDTDLAPIVDRFSNSTHDIAVDTDLVFLRIDSAESYERGRAAFTVR